MSQTSNIEWTDATWNPVRGCAKVSPGCANCYAETFAERWRGVPGHAYEQGFDLRLVPEKLDEPLRWRAGVKESCSRCMGSDSKNDAIACGACEGRGWTMRPKRVFVNSMSDLFQDGVPDEFIDRAFAIMALASQHTFQVLTKRAERMRDYIQSRTSPGVSRAALAQSLVGHPHDLPPANGGYQIPYDWPLRNVWLGVSVENQPMYDKRIGDLLRTPASVRFLSVEPMLGPIDLRMGGMSMPDYAAHNPLPQVNWIIVGGESGPGARPCNIDHIHSIVEQCQSASVPVFVKQLGAKPWADNNPIEKRKKYPYETPDEQAAAVTALGEYFENVDVYKLKDRKGGDMSEWPADLRVREFPEPRA